MRVGFVSRLGASPGSTREPWLASKRRIHRNTFPNLLSGLAKTLMAILFNSRRGHTASLMFIAPRSKPARPLECVNESSHCFLLTGQQFVSPHLRNKPNGAKDTITLRNAPLKSQRRASVHALHPHRNLIDQRWQRPRVQTQTDATGELPLRSTPPSLGYHRATLPTNEATDHDRLSSRSPFTGLVN